MYIPVPVYQCTQQDENVWSKRWKTSPNKHIFWTKLSSPSFGPSPSVTKALSINCLKNFSVSRSCLLLYCLIWENFVADFLSRFFLRPNLGIFEARGRHIFSLLTNSLYLEEESISDTRSFSWTLFEDLIRADIKFVSC